MAKFGGVVRLGLFRVAAPWLKRGRAARKGRRPQMAAGPGRVPPRVPGRGPVPLANLRPRHTDQFERAVAPLSAAEQAAMRRAHQEIARIQREAAGRPLSYIRIREMLQHINPTGSRRNCPEMALAVDDVLARRVAVAGPLPGAPMGQARGVYQRRAIEGTTRSDSLDAAERTIAANPGSRGIVMASGTSGNAHIYNVANVNGRVLYLDGQYKLVSPTNPHSQFTSFEFFRTA
ncbi:toxin glutamine deamidase domain-containing protein [Nonomuraea sp. NPDC050394]|uniref:toxin glutamine deamidase domain-containing protein n=1 Tax=Nonomuraea sp. NPDC050394 TaxID=3364363 RepID=UPI00378D2669